MEPQKTEERGVGLQLRTTWETLKFFLSSIPTGNEMDHHFIMDGEEEVVERKRFQPVWTNRSQPSLVSTGCCRTGNLLCFYQELRAGELNCLSVFELQIQNIDFLELLFIVPQGRGHEGTNGTGS